MRPVLNATEYERALRDLSPDQLREAAQGTADAARELMDRYGLCRALFLCDEPLQRIGALAAQALEAPLALVAQDRLPDLSQALVCDLLFSASGRAGSEAWMKAVAESGCPVLSLGIPAGVDPDSGRAKEGALKARITLSPFAYLAGLFLHDGLDHAGEIRSAGSPLKRGEGLARFEDADAVAALPPRKRTAHKGDSGKALLCVGSPRYVGAALLSARACLAAGCGILYVACPDPVRAALGRLPEAIGIPVGPDWSRESCLKAVEAMAGKQAMGLGCGAGDGDLSPLIEAALRSGMPLVLDADGLNCLSRHPELLSLLHDRVVLTPHPGEMSRLTGFAVDRVLDDPVALATVCARRWGCTVLLKGAATVVSDGTRTRIVAEGNGGLGKGGSGDVLTGIVTGLLAQGVEPYTAACLGSYLLGTSAQKAFKLLRERMLRATSVIEALEDWNQ